MIGWYWILGFIDLSFCGDEGLFQMAPIEESFIWLICRLSLADQSESL